MLLEIAKDKRNFPVNINKVLALISKKVGVKNWKKAAPFDIKLRDKIYDNISLTSGLTKDGNTAVRVGIVKGFEEMGLDNPFLVSQRKA